MWAICYNSFSSILEFWQSASFGFTKAALDGAAVTQVGLNNSFIRFVKHIRWKVFLGMLYKSKASISLIVSICLPQFG